METTDFEEVKECNCDCKCSHTFWKCFALFLLGVVVGFMFAPIKQGLSVGSNNQIHDNSAAAEGCDSNISVGSKKEDK